MQKISKLFSETTSSLKTRNFRIYFLAQIISSSGSFMQVIAQQWLILHLTNSGIELGIVAALQFLPILILGPFAGSIIDRFSKRRLIAVCQILLAISAISLGIIVIQNMIEIWMIYVFAFIFGLITTVNLPSEQSFILEIVKKEELKNAVALDNIQINIARIAGPAIGAAVIIAIGIGACFIFNGLTYLIMVGSLAVMNKSEIKKTQLQEGKITDGIEYIATNRELKYILLIIALIGTITYEFTVSLPLIAKFTLNGDAGTYALLTSAMGIGAIIGGIFSARAKSHEIEKFVKSIFLLGFAIIGTSIAPTLELMIFGMGIIGFCSINFLTIARVCVQIRTKTQMMGRVMVFWSVAFLGSTAVGGPLIGFIGETFDPRLSLAVGGIAAIASGIIGERKLLADARKRTHSKFLYKKK